MFVIHISGRGVEEMGIFRRFFKPDIEKMERDRDVEGLIEALRHEGVRL